MTIFFLSIEQVRQIHIDQIKKYGGSREVRDFSLLESALSQAEVGFDGEFLHKSLFEMAAAYVFHIVKNHPFIDGNKRSGIVTALTFLIFNGYELQCSDEELEFFVLEIAQGRIGKPEISLFFEEKSVKLNISLTTKIKEHNP